MHFIILIRTSLHIKPPYSWDGSKEHRAGKIHHYFANWSVPETAR